MALDEQPDLPIALALFLDSAWAFKASEALFGRPRSQELDTVDKFADRVCDLVIDSAGTYGLDRRRRARLLDNAMGLMIRGLASITFGQGVTSYHRPYGETLELLEYLLDFNPRQSPDRAALFESETERQFSGRTLPWRWSGIPKLLADLRSDKSEVFEVVRACFMVDGHLGKQAMSEFHAQLERHGFDIPYLGEPAEGSWWQDFVLRRGRKAMKTVAEGTAAAAADTYLRKPGAEATRDLAEAAATGLAAIGDGEGVMAFNNLLVGRARGSDGVLRTVTFELTVQQRRVIDRHPDLLSRPTLLLERLREFGEPPEGPDVDASPPHLN